MFYEVKSFTALTKAERPTREQVAAALAQQYAMSNHTPSGKVPVKEHIDELLDKSELVMPGYRAEGIVEAATDQEAVQQIILVKYEGQVDKDRRFYAIPINTLFQATPSVSIASVTD